MADPIHTLSREHLMEKKMRAVTLGMLMFFVTLIALPTAASAAGRLQWECRHGNEHACHMLRHRNHEWNHHHHHHYHDRNYR